MKDVQKIINETFGVQKYVPSKPKVVKMLIENLNLGVEKEIETPDEEAVDPNPDATIDNILGQESQAPEAEPDQSGDIKLQSDQPNPPLPSEDVEAGLGQEQNVERNTSDIVKQVGQFVGQIEGFIGKTGDGAEIAGLMGLDKPEILNNEDPEIAALPEAWKKLCKFLNDAKGMISEISEKAASALNEMGNENLAEPENPDADMKSPQEIPGQEQPESEQPEPGSDNNMDELDLSSLI